MHTVIAIVVGVLTTGGILTLILFLFKNYSKRSDRMEATMAKLVTSNECDIRHKRIDEHLIDGKETMNKLVELTASMDKTLGVVVEKIDQIKKDKND